MMLVKILVGICTLIVLACVALVILQMKNRSEVNRIWHSLETEPTITKFTQDMVVELPPPVQRYFLHAITPGTPLANSVELKMAGNFKLGDKWLPMKASEILSTRGFVWKAAIGQRLSKFFGADYYTNAQGRVQFSLWGIVPVASDRNPDTVRSSIGRLAGELIWLPSALLPPQDTQKAVNWKDVSWKAIDDNTIQANFQIDNEPISLTLVIDSNGKPLKISFPRWGNQTEDGQHTYIPFGGEILAEREFAGFTIPSQLSLGWWFGSDSPQETLCDRYAEFFHGTIEQAEFH
ncbi:DUF6920 family protein [Calothrix sp. UHCC 0171]|uniref:DUF6920 family protein n=1 Tax=Calothrix sp. UHCC 0171 TaxID=3110245 RepID=UPI002B1F4137|nr:DUF6544 family protein [Calothrix sp. UHCC 0171]MEA5572459.1 DUF6544 family protein [Calothrix sp. UHCC 0171]